MVINGVVIKSFEKWLQTLGYAESTVNASTNYVRDFFFYLKTVGVTELEQIEASTINSYYKYLQTRTNKRQAGGLSQNYIASNINALKRFSKYLQETGKPFFEVTIKAQAETTTNKTILSQEEIKALYKACENDVLGIRDRAILSIYYGCGLRRSEGIALNVSDILLKEKRVYVRKGKNYRERYVPMSEAVRNDLEFYIKTAREQLQSFKAVKQPALFLSMQVSRMHGNSLINRLHHLKRKAGINKEIGLHTLRHSIATHLLQSGMSLEEVSQFLGHASLESTQIYTHVSHE
ncbi:MAG TPA: hypothetical protein DDX98_07250 [Bacteroidales bacterium]|jgi:integrase/recombinase XerD|nr:hypothetical protein [Bacteroidales bacterium]